MKDGKMGNRKRLLNEKRREGKRRRRERGRVGEDEVKFFGIEIKFL
jgi:hypothetical protein